MCMDGCTSEGCFEKCCCWKCSCSLSPCCQGVCACCKYCTCCKYCCPCCCWPPRPCMAFFLGLIGFIFMLMALGSPDWLMLGDSGFGVVSVKGSTDVVTKASWGLMEGCVMAGGEWTCSPNVERRSEPKIEFEYNSKLPSWLGLCGLLVTVGEVILFIALVIVFLGLCLSCAPLVRQSLFRAGMYLYLVADLLFIFVLIFFVVKFVYKEVALRTSFGIGGVYGLGWGVVILVFLGALLLLLDKVPVAAKEEEEKLI